MSVVPRREDHVMLTIPSLPPTCAACGVETDRVVKGTPIPACGYHGGVEVSK